ncbi:MAG: hypothetical protein LC647_06500, partial [Beggiatoa sp.]|nr:hypothetical protein [Beggiatoa sp.]
LDARGARGRVDLYRSHDRQVDHETRVAHLAARHLVTSTSDADYRPMLSSHADRVDDVLDVGTMCDRREVSGDQPVPYTPGVVVGQVRGIDDLSPQQYA